MFVVGRLPEELAVGFTEAHEDTLVAGDGRVARCFVVGAHVDPAVRNDRAAVSAAAEPGHPLDVLAGFDVPIMGNVPIDAVYHVARDAAAEHGGFLKMEPYAGPPEEEPDCLEPPGW